MGPGARRSLAINDWLQVSFASGIGPRGFARLLEHFGEPGRVLSAGRTALREAGLRPETIQSLLEPDLQAIDQTLSWLDTEGAHVLTLLDAAYPPLLKEIRDPPPLLFVQGDPRLLQDPQIAIVGSRNPTPSCVETTEAFAEYLAGCGLVITSGLALGVDGAAHRGALRAGRTIAVLGTGPDRVYPARHRDLARHISSAGALVSELRPGIGPEGRNFPRRNRLISGMSLGTLVTEAAMKSGSLITARCAGEQGREVFALPGSIHNPMARGCHALIREGAKLVETARDIFEELAPGIRAALTADEPPAAPESTEGVGQVLDPEYRQLLDAMGYDPVAADDLIQRTGLAAKSVASMLLLLELQGAVSSVPGGRYCRNR